MGKEKITENDTGGLKARARAWKGGAGQRPVSEVAAALLWYCPVPFPAGSLGWSQRPWQLDPSSKSLHWGTRPMLGRGGGWAPLCAMPASQVAFGLSAGPSLRTRAVFSHRNCTSLSSVFLSTVPILCCAGAACVPQGERAQPSVVR